MPSEPFLHERDDFKALVETAAASEKINDPALVEKDYWIMHTVFGLKQLGLGTPECCPVRRPPVCPRYPVQREIERLERAHRQSHIR